MGSVAHSRRIPRERGCLRHDLRPQVGSPSPSARVIAHCRRHVQDLILGGCWHLILMHASCREIPRGSHRPRFGIPTSQFISCILQSCSYSWPWVRCKSTRKNTRPLSLAVSISIFASYGLRAMAEMSGTSIEEVTRPNRDTIFYYK